MDMPPVLGQAKSQLESSVANFSNISRDISKNVSSLTGGLSASVSSFQNAIGKSIGSLTSAGDALGKAVSGAFGGTGLSSLTNTLTGSLPGLDSLKKLGGDLSKSLGTAKTGPLAALKANVDNATQEASKTTTNINICVNTLKAQTPQLSDLLPKLEKEITDVNTAIGEYSSSLGAYVFNPSSNPFPVFDQSQLNVDQLLEEAQNNKDAAVDLASGAINATIYKVAGISRELGVRAMTKAMMYDAAVDRAVSESDDARSEIGRRLAELKGSSPEQTDGV